MRRVTALSLALLLSACMRAPRQEAPQPTPPTPAPQVRNQLNGLTPNPCIRCNGNVRLAAEWRSAARDPRRHAKPERRRHRSGGLHLGARKPELTECPPRCFGDHRVGIVAVVEDRGD